MPRSQPAIGAASLLAWLAACTVGPQSAAPPPSPALPTPPATIDGTYNGVMRLASGAAIACGTQDSLTLVVRNKAFRYVLEQPQVPWQPQRSFAVAISPDGGFRAASGTAYIAGSVGHGHMSGQIVGDSCSYAFEADSTGTF